MITNTPNTPILDAFAGLKTVAAPNPNPKPLTKTKYTEAAYPPNVLAKIRAMSTVGAQYYIPSEALPPNWETSDWFHELTVTPKPGFSKTTLQPFNMFTLFDSCGAAVLPSLTSKTTLQPKPSVAMVGVPRFYGLSKFGMPFKDVTTCGSPMGTDCVFTGVLKDTEDAPQTTARDEVVKALRTKGGAVLKASCGLGKTVIAVATACSLGRSTLIVVTNSQLMEQSIERVHYFVPGASIGIIKQDTMCVSADFVIASLQTILSREYPPSFFENFGLAIFDEVHFIAAKAFSTTLRQIPCRYILGLTATPDRSDGLGYVLDWIVGKQAFQALRTDTPMNVVYCTYTRTKTREIVYRGGRIGSSKMISNLALDEDRTAFIVTFLLRVLRVNPNRKIIVLTERRDHAKHMQELLYAAAPRFWFGIVF